MLEHCVKLIGLPSERRDRVAPFIYYSYIILFLNLLFLFTILTPHDFYNNIDSLIL